MRAKEKEIALKKTTEKTSETQSCFSEKINKVDKTLARLIKKERNRVQINKIRNKREEVTMDTTEIQRIIRDYSNNYMPIKWIT